MQTKLKQFFLATAALAVLALAPAAVKADPVTLDLPGMVSILAGSGPFTISGTITNGAVGDPTINLLGFVFTLPTGFTASQQLFLDNAPLTLDGGASYGPAGLFTLDVDASVLPGLYVVSASFEYSIDGVPGSIFITKDINVNVIPEPATMFLLATGLGGAALAKRRAKLKGKTETSS